VTELLEGGFPNTQNGVLSLDDLGAVVGWAETMPWKKQAPK
jgi:hypothetical protein